MLLSSGGVSRLACPSVQRVALASLASHGPAAVVAPRDTYHDCVAAGLIPLEPLGSPVSAVGTGETGEGELLVIQINEIRYCDICTTLEEGS